MARSPNRRVRGRYDLAEITRRIVELREKRNIPVKALCAEVGMEKWDWSRKTRFDRSTFSIEEIGAIADALDAPPGWPFLDCETEEFLAAAVRMVRKLP